MDSIIWAIKHSMRDISDMGPQICVDMLNNFSKTPPGISNAFHQQFFCSILQDILYVLTNSFYSSGFKLQSLILMQMFAMVEAGQIGAVLSPGRDNREYLRVFVCGLLSSAFPHLNTYTLANLNHLEPKLNHSYPVSLANPTITQNSRPFTQFPVKFKRVCR